MKHNLYNMMGLDMFLSGLDKGEVESLSKIIVPDSRIITPLKSWDFYSQVYKENLLEAERLQDIGNIKVYANRLRWQNNIDDMFAGKTFEALILTDLHQRILWVNKGFTAMTGYAKNEVLNKSPKILQGQETSCEARRNIKKKLLQNKPFTEVITNYKKDGTPYKCEVNIFPLKSNNHKTHYIALERQVA